MRGPLDGGTRFSVSGHGRIRGVESGTHLSGFCARGTLG